MPRAGVQPEVVQANISEANVLVKDHFFLALCILEKAEGQKQERAVAPPTLQSISAKCGNQV
jgi:hypothetical protein